MKMSKRKIFNIIAILLGVITCFSFCKVQASESMFTETIPTRNNVQPYNVETFSDTEIVPVTLKISESEYKTNNGHVYWTITDSNGTYKDIYCLNLTRGFGNPDGAITNANNTKEYKNQYDLNNIADAQYTELTGLTTENKNKILWILNNSLTSEEDLTVILKAASSKIEESTKQEFIKADMESNTRESTKLTFDDIKIIQQIAIWQYTNPSKQENVFYNTYSAICDKNGNSISGLMNEKINIDGYGTQIWNGEVKQAKLNALYEYFIGGADSNTTKIPTLSLSNENVVVIEENNNYIVGPFSLTGTNTELITEITSNINIDYTLLNSSKTIVSNNDFSKVLGSNFYLKVNKNDVIEKAGMIYNEKIAQININLNYKYSSKNVILLTDADDYTNTQPVAIVESTNEDATINTSADIKFVSATVMKEWEDNTNQDGLRPDSIEVQLFADGEPIGEPVTLNDSNSFSETDRDTWLYTWYNLLELPEGKIYAVKELDRNNDIVENGEAYNEDYIAGYEYYYMPGSIGIGMSSIEANHLNGITNTHDPEITSVRVTKTWNDSNNQDGKRPRSITVNLLANENVTTSQTITANENWSYEFTNLPKYNNGEEIIYTITEDTVDGYAKTITGNMTNGFNITNTYTTEVTSVRVTKIWNDNNNQDGKRPRSITVNLLANGVKVEEGIITSSHNWEYEFTNLPKYSNGEKINYTITENEVTAYTTTITGNMNNEFTITNTYTPEKISKKVTKVWNDNNNQDGKRAEYGVTLKANGVAVGEEVKLNAGTLTYTWENLPKYENGEEIEYTVDETTVPEGYSKKVEGFTITNTYTPETIKVEGTKTWNDADDQDGKRPESIKVNLLANGSKIKDITVTAENDWKYEFTNLPKYNNGEEINYTIDEDVVANYRTEIEGYNITNSYTPGKVSKKVIKKWEDSNNADSIRPESITVELYKLVNSQETTVDTKELNIANNWTYTWSNLDEKSNGEKIIYGIKEISSIEGYVTTYSAENYENVNEITITNTHIPTNFDVQIQKVDEQGNVIESSKAEFEIAGAQSLTDETEKGILDLNSQKITNNFEYTYTIKETKAPIGYNEIPEELSVKISGTTKVEEGSYIIDTINFTDKDGNELDNSKISAEYNRDLNKVIIKIANTKVTNGYSVKLLKVGEDGTTPLEGAWFKLVENESTQPIQISTQGTDIDTGVLNSEGEINLTYVLEETTQPNGYIKIEGQKEVKIKAKVELQDNTYQITEVELLEEIDEISISEENNIITIKVKNEPIIITGQYNVVLKKVDENGNILNGSKFKVSGTEYDLSTGEVTIYENQQITEEDLLNGIDFTYIIEETLVPVGYNGIEISEVNIKAQVEKIGNNYKLSGAKLVDSEGNEISNENISIELNRETGTIIIKVTNKPIEKEFDLALRKFITKVNEVEYSRQPVVDTSTIESTGTATYKHVKTPVVVQKGDVVTYTIRVYNEGELDGYVDVITDYLPSNLLPIIEGVEGIDSNKYKQEIEFNSNWLWQMSSEIENAVLTTITAKPEVETYAILTGLEEVTDTKLDAYVEGSNELDYIDVQIKCLVTENTTNGEYLTNIAEITDSQDINGVKGDGFDSELNNVSYSNLSDYKNNEAINSTENSYVQGQEDDDDFEKLIVQEFDLALRKFITKVNEVMHTRVPVVDTSKLGTTVNGKVVTTATYTHSKQPVIVKTNDIVTYTIRIYNEGSLAGFANEITDDLPVGLEFLPNDDLNKQYGWKMLDKDGKQTTDITKAVKVITDYLSDKDEENIIQAVKEENGVKVLSYKDVNIRFKIIAKPEKLKENIIINEAQISADSERDIDSIPNREEKYNYTSGINEDDIDYEPIKLQYFDLALRKFITKVNSTDYNNRYPEIVYNADGSVTYKHTKDPVLVTTGDTVIYTIRIYNEGEIAGYATEIKDNLPTGLAFDPNNEINKLYKWKMLDTAGNETAEAYKVVAFSTDYLKDQLIDAIVIEENSKILSYKDVQIAFKVTESMLSDRILVNTAQISKDSDDDIDSTPGNDVLTEDDIDREYVKVQYFDLSIKKWVTKTEVTYNGKTTTTKTGFDEDSDKIAKVDLVASKMNKTTVKFTYKIKVTNEGELPGYAYEVKDYIPKGLEFVAKDNKEWTQLEDRTVVTDILKDSLLNPGESATVEIVLTWKNSTTNTGLKTNYAEISKDSADDIDSVPDNYDFTEDDMDDAQVILSIKTAGATTYISLVLITVTILAGGIFLIKKYVLN